MKIKVEKVTIGNFGYDSITVKIDGKETEICFDKKDNVSKYYGKMIELVSNKGVYSIKEVKETVQNK